VICIAGSGSAVAGSGAITASQAPACGPPAVRNGPDWSQERSGIGWHVGQRAFAEVSVDGSRRAHLPSMWPPSPAPRRLPGAGVPLPEKRARWGQPASPLRIVGTAPPPPPEDRAHHGLLLAPSRARMTDNASAHAAQYTGPGAIRCIDCRPSLPSTAGSVAIGQAWGASSKGGPPKQAGNVSQMASSCATAYLRHSHGGSVRSASTHAIDESVPRTTRSLSWLVSSPHRGSELGDAERRGALFLRKCLFCCRIWRLCHNGSRRPSSHCPGPSVRALGP